MLTWGTKISQCTSMENKHPKFFVLGRCVDLEYFTSQIFLVGIYLFKVDKRNIRAMCESCSKLTIKTPERHQLCRSGVFIVNFEQISHIILVFPLLTLNKSIPAGILPSKKQVTTFLIYFSKTTWYKTVKSTKFHRPRNTVLKVRFICCESG